MTQVGAAHVADQANTTQGYAKGVGAKNVPSTDGFGENVGDGGVVDLYSAAIPVTTFYIADELAPGYVQQEDGSKIILESS